MPNLLDEDLLPFASGIRSLPGRPHLSWGYRAMKGIRGVKLETILVGGRRWVSRQALRRFVEAVTAASNNPVQQSLKTTNETQPNKQLEKNLDNERI